MLPMLSLRKQADVRAYCSHVKIYCKSARLLSSHPWLFIHSFIHSFIQWPTLGDTTTGFPTKWRLRSKRRNYILMTPPYPDLGSASDWLSQISNRTQPIRCTTQVWVVTRHQYGISLLVSQSSFHEETSGGVAKCQLFSQASLFLPVDVFFRCTFSIQSLVFQWNCRISEIVCWVPPLESSSNQDDNKGNEKIQKQQV